MRSTPMRRVSQVQELELPNPSSICQAGAYVVALMFGACVVSGCGASGSGVVSDSDMKQVEEWTVNYPELIPEVKTAFEDSIFTYNEFNQIEEQAEKLQESKTSEKWSKWAFELKEPKPTGFQAQQKLAKLEDEAENMRLHIKDRQYALSAIEAQIKDLKGEIEDSENSIPNKALTETEQSLEFYPMTPEYKAYSDR